MSQHRISPKAGWAWGSAQRGPNGRGICRWCGEEVPKGRRTFCGPACVHEWRIRTDPGYVRAQVERRDRGVCAECGLDTEALREAVQDLAREVWVPGKGWRTFTERRVAHWRRRWVEGRGWRWVCERPVLALFLAAAGLDWVRPSGHCWEADHIVPVIEGGGECGLPNYRTLCLPCHHQASAELARRRAQQRRQERPEKARLEF